MRKQTFVALILILTGFFIFSGCGKKISIEYKTVSLESQSTELDAHLSYPQFTDPALSNLNKEISNQEDKFFLMVDEYKNLWNEWYDAGLSYDDTSDIPFPRFSCNENFEVHISKDLITVIFIIDTNTRGDIYGDLSFFTYCYDTKKKKFRSLEDASGMSLKSISEKCASVLSEMTNETSDSTDIARWIFSSVSEETVGDMGFTVDNGSVQIYFPPLPLSILSSEPVKVTIK